MLDAEAAAGDSGRADRLAQLQQEIGRAQQGLESARRALATVKQRRLSDEEARRTIADFDLVWQSLKPPEREQILKTIVEQVTYDGETGQVGVRFRLKEWKTVCSTTDEIP